MAKHEEFLKQVMNLTESNILTVLHNSDVLKLLAIIEKLKEQRNSILWELTGDGNLYDLNKELDEIVGQG